VQFFAGKRATLVELLHTLDFLIEEGRQIVLSADRPPAELDDLGRELVHRINAGMVCRIEPPEYETRLGIVRRLAGKTGIRLQDDIAAYIASNLTGHARELSGAINRLHATHVALGEPISLAMAQETLAELIRYSARAVKLKDIELAICDVFGLERETLQSERRTKEISGPRMLAMWLARKHTRAALSEIGHYFGRRSHSTVVSAQKTVGGWMQSQQVLHVAQGRCTIDEAIRRVERLLQVG
jgi:chromosomal replication initiator protein